MKTVRYTVILALMLGLTACGVRRDLVIPKPGSQTEQQNDVEAAPAKVPVE